MTSARITKLLLLCGLALSTATCCTAQKAGGQQLQLTIRQTSSQPTFQFDLHNIDKQPLIVRAVRYVRGMKTVEEIQLYVTDSTDKTIPIFLNCRTQGEPVENCNLNLLSPDTYVVSDVTLQPGESYSGSIDLKNYIFQGERNINMSLTPGRYTLRAFYMEDIPKGSPLAISNSLPFTIPAK